MKNKILGFALMLMLASCVNSPILNKNEYAIVDTLRVCKNGLDDVLGYQVIVKIDSSYYYAELNEDKQLTSLSPRKLKLK
jgi:hypothetical protein